LIHLKEITNINTTTDLIKSVVLKINEDVLVNKKKQTIKQLKKHDGSNCLEISKTRNLWNNKENSLRLVKN